jgi:hypothetical protein
MSTNAVSASNQINLSTLLGSPKVSQRHGDDGERDSSGGNAQGITLLASLLQALIQAATSQPAPAASTPPATGAAPPTDTSGGPSATLVQDLQAFLHDLFHALRHANRESHGDRIVDPRGPATPTSGAAATPPVSAAAPATAPATAASTVTAHYRHHGIIYALQGLIRDLGATQAPDSTVSTSGTPSTALTKLNAAFEKLLGDLTGSASGGSAAGSGQSTSALQSFLTNFLQDLQGNAVDSFNTLGSSVNTTA